MKSRSLGECHPTSSHLAPLLSNPLCNLGCSPRPMNMYRQFNMQKKSHVTFDFLHSTNPEPSCSAKSGGPMLHPETLTKTSSSTITFTHVFILQTPECIRRLQCTAVPTNVYKLQMLILGSEKLPKAFKSNARVTRQQQQQPDHLPLHPEAWSFVSQTVLGKGHDLKE